jgi:uncharacterized sulfatase
MKLLCPLVVMAFAALGGAAGADDRPNVIVIFTDDHGYADLGSQGVFDDLATPHLDALAAGGVRMTSGYVTAPQCVPSRAGLLTGRYQNRFGVESNGASLEGFHPQQTIAERLKRAGYATGMTGKWHLGPGPEIVAHGFDDVYFKHAARGGWANFDLHGKDREPGPEASDVYHLDANSAAACAFIERHRDEPFFFYCAFRAPHVPLDAPPNYLERFPGEMPERRRKALAMLSAVDDGVGKILGTLRKHGLEEQTLIFFIGDNGAPLKIHKLDEPGSGAGWNGSLNDPLNGEKGMLSEGGIRVPFLVYWKGRIAGGRTFDHPVISLDVAATAVALAGLEKDPRLDGVNLLPHLSGENRAAPHATLYWRWIDQSAVREGKWKYLRGGPRQYLFDLESDREEKHNLLAEHPEIAERLEAKLTAWSADLQPPGIETKELAQVWQRYYDHFLDGKPAPAPAKGASDGSSGSDTPPDAIQGWLARNATAKFADGALVVLAADKKRRPFIAMNRLDLPPGVTAPALTVIVRLHAGNAERFDIAWRESGQNGFPAGQVAKLAPLRSGDGKEVRATIPAKNNVVHVRLMLPPGGAQIETIRFEDADGKTLKSWRFAD